MNHKRSRRACIVVLAVAALALAACGDDDNTSTQGTTATTASSAASATSASGATTTGASGATTSGASGATTTGAAPSDPVAAAQAATERALQGTDRPVDPTPRAAASGKHIVIISAGQASISSLIPVNAAEAAAKAMGWQVDVYDAKLNPANYSPLVRQAIAAGADGIIVNSIDCQAAKAALFEAKAKGIAIVPQYAFDCNDPLAGNEAEGVFSAYINYGAAAANLGDFTERYGADQANYIIADSENKAKIIALQDEEFVVLKYTFNGFDRAIEQSGGSEIVSKLDFTVADLGSGQLPAKVQAELLKHPEANWLKTPYTAATLAAVPAMGAKAGNEVKVMGGEGFQPELDLARQGKINAMNIVSSEWTGWASIDTMNSVFLTQEPVDSGLGWTIVDQDHGLPASGEFVPTVDFKAAYLKAWGKG